MKFTFGALTTAMIFAGCATPLTDADRTPSVAKALNGSIAVGVLDRREEILSKGKKDTWEGLGHGVYGIPYYHHTRSNLPVATYLAEAMARGFRAKSAKPMVIRLPAAGDVESARARVGASGAGRGLLMVLKKWYVDYGNTSIELFYDAEVFVLDSQGRTLSSKNFTGSEVTEFGMMTSYYDQIEKAHTKRLQAILSDYAVVSAL
jgi:hypothetical protein